MKEIHAYRNEDGTYRIKAIGEIHDGYQLNEVVITASRARIDMKILAEFPPKRILYTVEMEENNNETD